MVAWRAVPEDCILDVHSVHLARPTVNFTNGRCVADPQLAQMHKAMGHSLLESFVAWGWWRGFAVRVSMVCCGCSLRATPAACCWRKEALWHRLQCCSWTVQCLGCRL